MVYAALTSATCFTNRKLYGMVDWPIKLLLNMWSITKMIKSRSNWTVNFKKLNGKHLSILMSLSPSHPNGLLPFTFVPVRNGPLRFWHYWCEVEEMTLNGCNFFCMYNYIAFNYLSSTECQLRVLVNAQSNERLTKNMVSYVLQYLLVHLYVLLHNQRLWVVSSGSRSRLKSHR